MVRDKGFLALSDPVMQSPNCNAIEHLWLILNKQIRARHPSNKEEWEIIPLKFVSTL